MGHRTRPESVLRTVQRNLVEFFARIVDDVEALVHGVPDGCDVRVHLESGVLCRLHPVDPVVVLGLEVFLETAHRLAAEEVREPVPGREACVDVPVFESDVEDVVVDADLLIRRSVSPDAEEMLRE